jgi:hypothetical protein
MEKITAADFQARQKPTKAKVKFTVQESTGKLTVEASESTGTNASIHQQRCSLLLNYLEQHGQLPPGAKVTMVSDFQATVYWHQDKLSLELSAK